MDDYNFARADRDNEQARGYISDHLEEIVIEYEEDIRILLNELENKRRNG